MHIRKVNLLYSFYARENSGWRGCSGPELKLRQSDSKIHIIYHLLYPFEIFYSHLGEMDIKYCFIMTYDLFNQMSKPFVKFDKLSKIRIINNFEVFQKVPWNPQKICSSLLTKDKR